MRSNLFTYVRDARWPHYADTLGLTAANLFGGLLPLYGSYLLLRLASLQPHVGDFIKHGEFALYSAAFLMPAIYLILKDLRHTHFIHRTLFGLLAIGLLIFALLLYAGVSSISIASPATTASPSPLDEKLLVSLSIGLFVASTILCMLISLIDNIRTTYDFNEAAARPQRKLESEFDNLGRP